MQTLTRRTLFLFFILLAILLPAASGSLPGRETWQRPPRLRPGHPRRGAALHDRPLNVPTDSPKIKVTGLSVRLRDVDRPHAPAGQDGPTSILLPHTEARQGSQSHARPSGWRYCRAAGDLVVRRPAGVPQTQRDATAPAVAAGGDVTGVEAEGRTITTPADLEALKNRGAGRGKQWVKYTDDQIWAMQPDSTIPRWHWVNVSHGCPVHGTDIYKSRRRITRGRKTRPLPYKWKIECPVGHELYPSNDFANGDMTSGEFPDDGFGGGCPYKGKRYGFIAETCQAYCHEMLQSRARLCRGLRRHGRRSVTCTSHWWPSPASP